MPPWSARFRALFSEDRPLVVSIGAGQYEKLDTWTVPTKLPRPPDIVGREALMTDSIRALANARLLTLTGSGGISKTTVAIAMAQWHADRELYRDGVFFVALEGVSDAARLVEALAGALNVTLDPVNPWHTLQAALAQRECLLLLDNAEGLLDDPTAAEASAVGELGKLLDTVPGLTLLVTSREALGLRHWEDTLAIEEMEPGEAQRLFLRFAPAAQRVELALAHRAEVQDICRTLAYYPLALVLAAPQLGEAGITTARLLRDLQQKMLEVLEDERSRGVPERLRSLRASLRLSYERLSGRARIVFFYLGMLPGGANEDVLATLVGKRFEPAARELVARNLARWQEGRYTLLTPLQAYAIETRPPKRLTIARLRAARFYAKIASTIGNLLKPISRRRIAEQLAPQSKGQTQEEVERRLTDFALITFDAERINLFSAVKWAFAKQAWEVVRTLVDNLNTYLDLRALWGDRVAINQTNVEAAKQEANRRAEGIALNNLGTVYRDQGRWAETMAAFEQSLAICRELGIRHGEGQTLNNLGTVYRIADMLLRQITCHGFCNKGKILIRPQKLVLPYPHLNKMREVAKAKAFGEGFGSRHGGITAVFLHQFPERRMGNGAFQVEMQFNLGKTCEPVGHCSPPLSRPGAGLISTFFKQALKPFFSSLS